MIKVTKPLAGVKHIKAKHKLTPTEIEEYQNERRLLALMYYCSDRNKYNELMDTKK